MEGEFTGASAQTMGAADVAGQQSGQEAAAQAQVQQQPANVPDAQGQGTQEETFDSLIRGRYKQDFDSAVQKVVKQRVRGLNQYKGQAEAMAPIIDQLGALYGIDTSDPRKTDFAALAQRFSADERLYSAEAMEKGTTTDALKKEYAGRAENTAMRRQLQEYQMREAFAGIQADFARDVTPRYGADFETEMQNPDLRGSWARACRRRRPMRSSTSRRSHRHRRSWWRARRGRTSCGPSRRRARGRRRSAPALRAERTSR